jgi:hypothetical protein
MILPEHLNQDTVKHANGRHAKNPSWPQSIAHHRGFLIIKPSVTKHKADPSLRQYDVRYEFPRRSHRKGLKFALQRTQRTLAKNHLKASKQILGHFSTPLLR